MMGEGGGGGGGGSRVRANRSQMETITTFFRFVNITVYFPAQLARGFTLRDLLDKSWSQVSPPFSPGTRLQFFSRIRLVQQPPLLVDLHRKFAKKKMLSCITI